MENIKETINYLRNHGIEAIDFGMILGSGLGDLAEEVCDSVVLDYGAGTCRKAGLWIFG